MQIVSVGITVTVHFTLLIPYSASRSGDTQAVPVDPRLQPRIARGFDHQIDLHSQHPGKLLGNRGKAEQVDARRPVEPHRQIDVGFRRSLAARGRSEQRQPCKAERAQARLVAFEAGDGGFALPAANLADRE